MKTFKPAERDVDMLTSMAFLVPKMAIFFDFPQSHFSLEQILARSLSTHVTF